MPKKLMIVESPHKAKMISGFLGPEYIVKASMGHVRELADSKHMTKTEKEKYSDYAIDVDHNFDALYKVAAGKTKVVSELRQALNQCDEILFCGDPDREGEAISWHILDLLQKDIQRKNIKVSRATWTEITKKAVEEGLAHKRQIDPNMVDSAISRSLYDRLFGYSISPVLWKTVARGTSGGRVQSPALRLIVSREKERLAFRSANYMSVQGLFHVGDTRAPLTAKLLVAQGQKIATGNSFDAQGNVKAGELVLDENTWGALEPHLQKLSYAVSDVSTKPYRRRPPAPYTTSSFQQDVGTRLRLGSKQIMSIAQQLYDAGYCTYMRTDSPMLSQEGIKAARQAAQALYGPQGVPTQPNIYKAKGKNAQEGHEALRPTVDDHGRFPSPQALKSKLDRLDRNAYRVYECIYKRTVASQMNDAVGITTTVRISSINTEKEDAAHFATSATVFTDPGWTALMKPVSNDEEENNTLQEQVAEGEEALLRNLTATEHQTTAPARFTEPSLVQKLEELGIGRPSTYAAIVTVNQTRGYVLKKGQQLYPSWTGMKVAQYLEEKIPSFVAYDATALMEEHLDKIEEGTLTQLDFLSEEWKRIREEVLPLGESIDWSEVEKLSTIPVAEGYQVRVNSKGAWLEDLSKPLGENGYRQGVRLSDEETLGDFDFTDPQVCKSIMEQAANRVDARELGVLTVGKNAGWTVTARDGRYGPYLQAVKEGDKKTKPETRSLPKDADLSAITLEEANKLFAEVKLPRTLNDHLFTGIGARGPWLGYKATPKARRAVFVSLPEGMDPRTITAEEAQAVWDEKQAAKKQREAGKKTAAAKKAAPRKTASSGKTPTRKTAAKKTTSRNPRAPKSS